MCYRMMHRDQLTFNAICRILKVTTCSVIAKKTDHKYKTVCLMTFSVARDYWYRIMSYEERLGKHVDLSDTKSNYVLCNSKENRSQV
jgi:hypothetical protein